MADNGPNLHASGNAERDPGLGLSNTKKRLKGLDGATQRMDIAAAHGEGERVTSTVPFRVGGLDFRPAGARAE